MLELPLLSAAVRTGVLVAAMLALAVLLRGSGRRWWLRTVPAAAAGGALFAAVLVLVVQVIWRPFSDPLSTVAVLWTGVTGLAAALVAGRWRHGRATQPDRQCRRTARTALGLALVAVVAVAGAEQVNVQYAAHPTLRDALALAVPGQVPFARLARAVGADPAHPPVTAPAGRPLSSTWMAPADLPRAGTVTTVDIPGTRSGFRARPAYVYLPPAYLTVPRVRLPVLVLLAGQPGSPRDWLDGGKLSQVMDSYAAAHHGLAPVVVAPDPLGSPLGQTLCVDSPHGNAFTYLSVDVPAWIRSTLQVDPAPAHWAVGGASFGGTCALQLAVNAPTVYPTFLDLAGQDAPTVGDPARTLAQFFGGNQTAFDDVDPLHVLANGPPAGLAGVVVAGSTDTTYRPQADRVVAALRRAGVPVQYTQLPGGHSWQVWGPGLQGALPWLSSRTGLAP